MIRVLVCASIFQGQRWPHANPYKWFLYIRQLLHEWATKLYKKIYLVMKNSNDRVRWSRYSFSENKKPVLAAILWSCDESYIIRTGIMCQARWHLVFLCRTKDERVMAIFLKSCSQKLEKDDFECLYSFDEGEFHCTLQSLASSEAEFNGE